LKKEDLLKTKARRSENTNKDGKYSLYIFAGIKGSILGAKIVSVGKPLEICQNVYSTGELGAGIKEESLLINTEKGLIIITGCAHPGIVKAVKRAKEILNTNVYLVMGGFHLRGMSNRQIDEIVEEFKKEGVKRVGPSHWSGSLTRELFEKAYGKDFIRVGVGKTIEIRQFETRKENL